ncbi:hypothetical protein BGZ46_002716, partial [Entomortierella lignicola]
PNNLEGDEDGGEDGNEDDDEDDDRDDGDDDDDDDVKKDDDNAETDEKTWIKGSRKIITKVNPTSESSPGFTTVLEGATSLDPGIQTMVSLIDLMVEQQVAILQETFIKVAQGLTQSEESDQFDKKQRAW